MILASKKTKASRAGRSKQRMKKTTVKNVMNVEKAAIILEMNNGINLDYYSQNKLSKAGYDKDQIIDIFVKAVNEGIVKGKSDREYREDFKVFIKGALNFKEAILSKELIYRCVHSSATNWTHYFSVLVSVGEPSLREEIEQNGWFVIYANQTGYGFNTSARLKKMSGTIKKMGCGYSKSLDIHLSGLLVLKTVGLITEEQVSKWHSRYTVI
jgi:hypothetical protein